VLVSLAHQALQFGLGGGVVVRASHSEHSLQFFDHEHFCDHALELSKHQALQFGLGDVVVVRASHSEHSLQFFDHEHLCDHALEFSTHQALQFGLGDVVVVRAPHSEHSLQLFAHEHFCDHARLSSAHQALQFELEVFGAVVVIAVELARKAGDVDVETGTIIAENARMLAVMATTYVVAQRW